MNNNKISDKRYIARIILEAETPLKIGTGALDFYTQSPVFTDADGFPQIPGTTLAGNLRHSLTPKEEDKEAKEAIDFLFGFSDRPQTSRKEGEEDQGRGSRLLITSGCLLLKDGKVAQGLVSSDLKKDPIMKKIRALTIREHCRISEKGSADTKNKGKFDEAIVPKGLRFVFEMELLSYRDNKKDQELWDKLIDRMKSPLFSLGGGVHRGFGRMTVKKIHTRIFDLTQEKDLGDYLERSSSLEELPEVDLKLVPLPEGFNEYTLTLKAPGTWLFRAPYGDKDNNDHPVRETFFAWNKNQNNYEEKKDYFLIPASSVKGALAHRTAYHYNRRAGNMIDLKGFFEASPEEQERILSATKKSIDDNTGESNIAVKQLFGSAADLKDKEKGSPGLVYIKDIYLASKDSTGGSDKSQKDGAQKDEGIKVFNHTAIDRFTGGARRGALYSEKTVFAPEEEIVLNIVVDAKRLKEDDPHILPAFKDALQDLCCRRLPLGGAVMRGHGLFEGTIKGKKECEAKEAQG